MKTCLTLLLLASAAPGATLKVAWNANPPADQVSGYEVRAEQVWGMQVVSVKTTATTAAVSGLQAGTPYFLSVRAVNAAGMSDFCAAITAAPKAMLRVVVQASHDMAAWADVAETARVMEAREFYRIKMEVQP